MQDELLAGSRAGALREVLRSLECDAATRALLDSFVPFVPGIKPCVPIHAAGAEHPLSSFAAAGAGFSIESAADLEVLDAAGLDPRAALFRSTGTHAGELREAALLGVWRFAIDAERELSVVGSAAPGAAIYVYLDVRRASAPGASPQEALRLLRLAPEYGLRPYGLAFHLGDAAADAATYAHAIDRCGLVMRRLEQLGTRLEMLSLGGSHGGDAAHPAVLAAVARLPYRPSLLLAEP